MADQPRARLRFAVVAPDVTAEHHPPADQDEALAELRRRAEAHAGQLFPDGFELEAFDPVVNLTDGDDQPLQWSVAVVAIGALPDAIPRLALGWDIRLVPDTEEVPRG